MTIKELKILLKYLDENALVVLQKDAEGNSYSSLSTARIAIYIPNNTWSGEVQEVEEENKYLPHFPLNYL